MERAGCFVVECRAMRMALAFIVVNTGFIAANGLFALAIWSAFKVSVWAYPDLTESPILVFVIGTAVLIAVVLCMRRLIARKPVRR